MVASGKGYADIVSFLLEAGADYNISNRVSSGFPIRFWYRAQPLASEFLKLFGKISCTLAQGICQKLLGKNSPHILIHICVFMLSRNFEQILIKIKIL